MRVATSHARALVPLFLVSLAAVGYETALIRYFAVAKWSEYGYWVISIVMVGFALSGVILALFRDAFARYGAALLAALPADRFDFVESYTTVLPNRVTMYLLGFDPADSDQVARWAKEHPHSAAKAGS